MELEIIAKNSEGLTFWEAVMEANRRKLAIAPNLVIDPRLQDDTWKKEKELYDCWTGTLAAYEKPGKPFGKTVGFYGLTFTVPEAFQGKKDMAILVNHPDFLLDGNTITPGASAKCLPIPETGGWYLPEPGFGFPDKESSPEDKDARRFWRQNGSYIGLVARGVVRLVDWSRCGVFCDYWPGYRLGVAGISLEKNFSVPAHEHDFVCRICQERSPIQGKDVGDSK